MNIHSDTSTSHQAFTIGILKIRFQKFLIINRLEYKIIVTCVITEDFGKDVKLTNFNIVSG